MTEVGGAVLRDGDDRHHIGAVIRRFGFKRIDRVIAKGVVAILVEDDLADSGAGARHIWPGDFGHDDEIIRSGANVFSIQDPCLVVEPIAAKASLRMHDRGRKSIAVQDIHLQVHLLDAAAGRDEIGAIEIDHLRCKRALLFFIPVGQEFFSAIVAIENIVESSLRYFVDSDFSGAGILLLKVWALPARCRTPPSPRASMEIWIAKQSGLAYVLEP